MLTGINGSGKSHILVKFSLETWHDSAVVLDIKGELLEHTESLRRKGIKIRPFIVFDPTQGGSHYDVYAILKEQDRLAQNVREIVHAIIPMPVDVREPYWINMACDYLSGVIVYYFKQGYSFIDTILLMQTKSVDALRKEIIDSDCSLAKTFISEIISLKKEQKAAIATDVKQHTMVFATDSERFVRRKNRRFFFVGRHSDERGRAFRISTFGPVPAGAVECRNSVNDHTVDPSN